MGLPSGGEKYRLIRTVGSGGMGVVYEAWDLRLDRRVALKFLHPQFTEGAENAERLEREARNAARIEHPNVVRVYGMETVNGQLVIEMQFIEGAPLHTILAAGKLAPGVAVDLLRQFLEALVACHSHGVVHCDLKPGNLLVTPDGQLYLTDFGISHSLRSAGTEAQSGSGKVGQWGTPRYTPPEAWYGGKPDPRWDLYSAGAVTYEMLCGEPFREKTTRDAVKGKGRTEQIRSITERDSEISPQLANLVDGLTAQDPRKRPKHAQEALALLRETPEYKQRETGHETITGLFQSMDAAEQTTKYVTKPSQTGKVFDRRSLAALALAMVLLFGVFVAFVWFPANPKGGSASPATDSTTLDPKRAASPASPPVAPVAVPPIKTINSNLVKTDSGVCFAYDDGKVGNELWWCGFFSEKMILLKDIRPGPDSSNPRNFLRRSISDFVFAATTTESGEEPWFALLDYDGSPRDIRQIMDVQPGVMDSNPVPITLLQSNVLFDAKTLSWGNELWCTNTSPDQTAKVNKDLAVGAGNSVPIHSRLTVDSYGAYMVSWGDGMHLSRFDLTTYEVRDIAKVDPDTTAIGVGENLLVLSNRDPEHGMELWIYDPTKPGIYLLADIYPGTESSGPGYFYTWKKMAFFRARTAEHGDELWCTDGTTEGTRELMDINPGESDGSPYGFIDAGSRLFFRAHDSAHGDELWVTDGTPESTQLAADAWPGSESGEPYNIVPQGKNLYFTADDGIHGEELWMLNIDDPANTAHPLGDLLPGPIGSEPVSLNWSDDQYGIFVAHVDPKDFNVSQLVQINQYEGNATFTIVPLP